MLRQPNDGLTEVDARATTGGQVTLGLQIPIGNLEFSHEHQEASKGVSQVRVFDIS